MSNGTTKGFSATPQARSRRERVIVRLEAQLKRGMRPPRKGEQTTDIPLLTDGDIKRIGKELDTLKKRV